MTSSISQRPDSVSSFLQNVPGLLLCLSVAAVASFIGSQSWLVSHGLSALTVAVVLGMVIGNAVPPRWTSSAAPGIALAKQFLLRAGIVLYGTKLTLQDIGHVGAAGVLIDVVMLSSTFVLAWLIGTRLLRLDRQTTLLVGAGSSICGAAAILATEPVVQADPEKVTVAVSTVVIFGTLAIFLYPAIYHLGLLDRLLPGGKHAFGVYEGSTIQEVAQVLAAAQGLGAPAAYSAVIAKMVRVMMLAPFLLGLAAWVARKHAADRGLALDKQPRLAIPWFAFLFIAVVGANSLIHWTPVLAALASRVDLLLLGMAMGALGMTTYVSSIRRAGIMPLFLGALLWGWLVIGGALINGLISRLV